jgi:hypothetical protein
VKLIKEAIKAGKKGYSKGEIVGWVVPFKRDRKVDEEKLQRWEGVKPYKESMIYTIIGELVDSGEIDPPPDSRK